MSHFKQDYNYALDDNLKLIHASDAKRESKYICPCCGHEMRPHMGSIRRWHFTHKSGSECNFETYLHKIAKYLIRRSYLESNCFNITYNPIHECSDVCPMNRIERCTTNLKKTFDLRQFYDLCDEEVQIDNFKADLLLSSSERENRPPILIEIYVSHKSSVEKIRSGHRIIEIHIQSVDDIRNIINSKNIQGQIYNSNYIHENGDAIFYNFNKKYTAKRSNKLNQCTYVFGVKNDGTFLFKSLLCNQSYSDLQSSGYNLVISDIQVAWSWAFFKLEEYGLNIRNCMRCYFYRHNMSGRICILYKKHGTPKQPKTSVAKECSFYKQRQCDELDFLICDANMMNQEYWKKYKLSYNIVMLGDNSLY